ncbi:MAG: FecR domain-containing protein, partial [Huintestinicola sp.]
MNSFLNTKKGKIIVISVVAVIAAAVLIFIFAGREKGYRSISISEISGSVTTENGGKKYEAYKNMKVGGGYVLSTDADSYTRLLLDSDKYIKLEQLSRAAFEELGTEQKRNTVIRLESGAITNEITAPLPAGEDYIVTTPNAVLAVRGTFFRVEVSFDENGDAYTDVYTYGGTVACRRIMPDGTVVDEEVLIGKGYKACVKMDEVITVYVEELIEGDEDNVDPIEMDMVSDDDLVDIYNASINGHQMFKEPTELFEEIERRDIDLSKYHSVYNGGEIVPPDTAAESKPSPAETTAAASVGTDITTDGIEQTETESDITTAATDNTETETNITTAATDPTEAETNVTTVTTAPTETETNASAETTAPTDAETDVTSETTAPTDAETDVTSETTAPTETETDVTTVTTAPTETETDATTVTTAPTETRTDVTTVTT